MITFFVQDIKFTLKNKTAVRAWLITVAKKEGAQIAELNYIFCSDNYLLDLNKKHLNHNTLTDIITFDTTVTLSTANVRGTFEREKRGSEGPKPVCGDIFISIERVTENAATYGVTFEKELHRVMVHGLLHLLGYKDKKPADKAEMTGKEDYYLKRF
jgi:probable rRNA maturation factor